MSPQPANKNPPDLRATLEGVSTATLTMVLLKRGIRNSWMRGPMPLHKNEPGSSPGRVVGEAFTVRFVPGREDLCSPASYAQAESFRDAIEACPPGAVMVVDARGTSDAATLGDILIARLKVRGVAAAVTDAPIRDVDSCLPIGLPVFSNGVCAPPSISGLAYAGHSTRIGCGGVAVDPGDYIVADSDGVVVIPRELAAEVAEVGAEQERYEAFVQQKVLGGREVVGLYPPDEATLAEYASWNPPV